MTSGGKREGAGRPLKHETHGARIDIYLPDHQIAWLREHGEMSDIIQKLIAKEIQRDTNLNSPR